jgi:hypothetical protein
MTVFWDVAPCGLVEVYQRFRGAYCFYHHSSSDIKETPFAPPHPLYTHLSFIKLGMITFFQHDHLWTVQDCQH